MNVRWILAAAAAGIVPVIILAFRAGGPERTPAPLPAASARESAPRTAVPAGPATTAAEPAAGPAVTAPVTPGAQAVPKILESIHEASISYDAKELRKIQPYLIHPEPEVRAAALDGVLVLGDAAGAPLLRQASSALKDPREAVKYLEAADYLELPSGSLLAGKKKAGPAAKEDAKAGDNAPARIPLRRNRD